MVILLIASLIAALGVFFYVRGKAPPVSGAMAPAIVPNQTETYGGTTFVVKPGTEFQTAAAQGATAYDISDPQTALRTQEAIARSQKMVGIAAAEGMTVDEHFAAKTTADIAANNITFNKALTYAQGHGFTPSGNIGQDDYQVLQAQVPLMGAQPPGTYWDYGQQKWVPLTF